MFEDRDLWHDMTEAERLLANTVLPGRIEQLDARRARVRVRCGELLTDWIPFAARRAGPDRTWHAPEPGEQVLLAAPGGDLTQAVVLGALYSQRHPAPASSADISGTYWADGALMEYDRRQHRWRLQLPDGSIELRVGGSSILITPDAIRLRAPRIELN
ncbi:MAG: phage baseplate assembly protein V [Rhodocyclaceae bacterium]|nr:phage baseplate assembly protein V [Rhodocyclaceae bacterium]